MRAEDLQPTGRGPAHICGEADGAIVAIAQLGERQLIAEWLVTDGFKHLQVHVATTAFDSKDDVDLPKCHPNTRTVVLDQIIAWILQPGYAAERLLWLYGAAGAGKSAIARTVVERCIALGIPIASFFFFRTDATRNTLDSLVATLAHQLIRCLPELRETIVASIQSEPLLFEQSLKTQLEHLIFAPLECAQLGTRPVVLLLDGVDELVTTFRQSQLIKTMAALAASSRIPVRVMFASRGERPIAQAFAHRSVAPLLHRIQLDDNYLPDVDIARFLADTFAEIRETHPCHYLLAPDWPPHAALEAIVAKSSGQFIYASLVAKFVSDAARDPARQLAVVLGLLPGPAAGAMCGPFAQLDALYCSVFAQIADLEQTTFLLAVLVLGETANIATLADMFPDTLSEAGIYTLLADLTAVVACEEGDVRFLHASLPEFLLDRARSGAFHIDRAPWATRIAMTFTQNIFHLHYFVTLMDFLGHADLTPELELRIAASLAHPPAMYPSEISYYRKHIRMMEYEQGRSDMYQFLLKAFKPRHADD